MATKKKATAATNDEHMDVTDLSQAPAEIKEAILKNDEALAAKNQTETEPQDPAAEPAEPKGEALSLDSIDDLVLPGDVDPGEEQQSQRWRITDDALAPLSMDLLQSSASQIRVRTSSDAPSCGPEWPSERATAARWRKRTAEAAKHQKRLAERPEEAPRKKHVRSFSFRKMQKSKNMKKFLRSY